MGEMMEWARKLYKKSRWEIVNAILSPPPTPCLEAEIDADSSTATSLGDLLLAQTSSSHRQLSINHNLIPPQRLQLAQLMLLVLKVMRGVFLDSSLPIERFALRPDSLRLHRLRQPAASA
ncbi:hypothetical protein FQN51_003910 [Onygenales sp. PD_10]|nr:hypothetical protein FQN51_003910 [Onygenales sp. PD_10]